MYQTRVSAKGLDEARLPNDRYAANWNLQANGRFWAIAPVFILPQAPRGIPRLRYGPGRPRLDGANRLSVDSTAGRLQAIHQRSACRHDLYAIAALVGPANLMISKRVNPASLHHARKSAPV